MTQALTVTSNWLDTTAPVQAFGQSSNNLSIGGIAGGTWYYPNYWYLEPRVIETPRKIKLRLSEVDRLRKAAKADEALKKVLQKFTPHIEVEIDL